MDREEHQNVGGGNDGPAPCVESRKGCPAFALVEDLLSAWSAHGFVPQEIRRHQSVADPILIYLNEECPFGASFLCWIRRAPRELFSEQVQFKDNDRFLVRPEIERKVWKD
jgi:hypothetical protein